MTKKERQNYKLIKESRIKRIASGSGSTIKAVENFIAKFRQMEKMMGGMMQMMKGGMPGIGGAMPGMPGANPGFRNEPGMGKKPKKKGKKKGPWGGGFFK